MKKIYLFIILAAALAGCTTAKAPKKSAQQEAAEECVHMYMWSINAPMDSIVSYEAEYCDSLLSDLYFAFSQMRLQAAMYDYTLENISKKEYHAIIDEAEEHYAAICDSWASDEKNAELKRDPRFESCLRPVYVVHVSFADGHTEDIRVLMDSDGSARFTEPRFLEEMQRWSRMLDNMQHAKIL